MIIFSDKKTGKIVGTIDGRIHSKEHLNMWVGDKSETNRTIINWVPFRWFDKDGKAIDKDAKDAQGNSIVYAADFQPDHPQKELIEDFDRRGADPKRKNVYEYSFDFKNNKFVKNKDNGKDK